MERREDTPMRQTRRRYEQRHSEERKAKSKVFGTSIDRALYEEINAFLEEHHISKVELIYKGYEALVNQVKKQ